MASLGAGVSRRQFVQAALAGGILAGCRGSWALAAGGEGEWSCPVLGDLHFDKLEHHDFDWLKKTHPGDLSQIQNYSRITRELTPRLLEAVKQRMATAKGPVPFVLQLGDLLEGLCGSEKLAATQANEAVAFIRQAQFGRPLLMTKGNHDITGPGAAEVYEKVLLPFMAGGSKTEISAAHFARQQGGTTFVFYDAYDKNSLDWFDAFVIKNKPERLVFLIHPPVVPYNARSSWHVYSHPRQAESRQRLLALLGRTKAVVLCGHLHKYCHLRRKTEHGSFVQLAISSVASSADGKPRDLLSGIEHYGPDLTGLEPRHSPDTLETRRQLLAAERPFIEHFEYADVWGHAQLHSRGRELTAEIFHGLAPEPAKTFSLSS